MPFYDDMAGVVTDLLKPDTAGGLGQGAIAIVRTSPGIPDPVQPWVPVAPTEIIEMVDQIGEAKAEYRIGETTVGVDRAFMIVPTKSFEIDNGDVVRIDGYDIGTVVRVERLGALDVPLYAKIYVNR